MKTLITCSLLVAFVSGCAGGPQPITKLTPGMDSALLNKYRGSSLATMNAAQAQQYARQQKISANEIKLLQIKRQENEATINGQYNSINNGINTLNNLKNFVDSF